MFLSNKNRPMSERVQLRQFRFGFPLRPPWPSYSFIVKNGQCVKPSCFLCAAIGKTDRCVAVVDEVLKEKPFMSFSSLLSTTDILNPPSLSSSTSCT